MLDVIVRLQLQVRNKVAVVVSLCGMVNGTALCPGVSQSMRAVGWRVGNHDYLGSCLGGQRKTPEVREEGATYN